jgi:hypothetical protein
MMCMETFDIIGILLLGGLAWLWFDSTQVRAIGIAAVKEVCAGDGVQLLDDTVSISRLSLARNEDGRLLLRRVYSFDYSETGDNRRRGSIVLLGQEVQVVNIGLRLARASLPLH